MDKAPVPRQAERLPVVLSVVVAKLKTVPKFKRDRSCCQLFQVAVRCDKALGGASGGALFVYLAT